MMGDAESKKRWDKEYMARVTVKLFRATKKSQNDQEIIDFLEGKVKSEIIKQALREYMENHKD